MKHIIRLSLIFIISFSAFSCSVFKSVGYEKITEESEVQINHRWVHPKKEGNPSSLFLEVRNLGSTDKVTNFKVAFYLDGIIKEESDAVSICLRPGTKRSGKTNGVYFQPYSITTEQILSESFNFEIIELEVTEESCN
jgi:hypothetical protein